MNPINAIKDRIEDYGETIYAIIGFINLYRFDDQTRSLLTDVVIFQGRRLTPSLEKATTKEGNAVDFVTPDFGILHKPGRNVLGDVKKSFPEDKTYWKKGFDQLMAYDDDLFGWPCSGERVAQHDVVLLTHQSRVVVVSDYYQEKAQLGEVRFTRPFSIISFNRSDERQAYFHFEKRLGELSDKALNDRLRHGIPVPMQVFVDVYSTVKLYDSMPPLPYLASLIWEHVVARRASNDPKFKLLRKNQKLDVTLTIDEIVQELHEGFSFRTFCPDYPERQPQVPKKEWCRRACDSMAISRMASWHDVGSKDAITIYFRKLDNVLDHFVEVCKDEDQGGSQMKLF